MIQKDITFFGKPCTLACDGRCSKAWGINGRPRIDLSDNPDDTVDVPDQYLGLAPGPGETVGISEGECVKPSAVDHADPSLLNKWCSRECERSALVDRGTPIALPNKTEPLPNMWRTRAFEHRIATLAREYAATLHLEHRPDTSEPCDACRIRSEAHDALIKAAEGK